MVERKAQVLLERGLGRRHLAEVLCPLRTPDGMLDGELRFQLWIARRRIRSKLEPWRTEVRIGAIALGDRTRGERVSDSRCR